MNSKIKFCLILIALSVNAFPLFSFSHTYNSSACHSVYGSGDSLKLPKDVLKNFIKTKKYSDLLLSGNAETLIYLVNEEPAFLKKNFDEIHKDILLRFADTLTGRFTSTGNAIYIESLNSFYKISDDNVSEYFSVLIKNLLDNSGAQFLEYIYSERENKFRNLELAMKFYFYELKENKPGECQKVKLELIKKCYNVKAKWAEYFIDFLRAV